MPDVREFIPSEYQKNFFTWVERGSGSAVLVAVAGSGKTTSVVKALKYVKPGLSTRLLAFNTTIADELKQRIIDEKLDPQQFSASTFHSLCFNVVRKYLEGRGVRVGKTDGGKMRALAREYLVNKFSQEEYDDYADFSAKLVGLAKGEGIGPLVPDTDDAWYALVQHHDLQLETLGATEERGIEHARSLLKLSNERAQNGYLDFDDQLYLVCLWKLRLWQNDWLFVDESQDTNPVRRAIMRLALRPGGRMVAVGDPRQAIYGFVGASHDAIEIIKQQFNAIELPLTVSYRCAKAIVQKAQTIVPYIEAYKDAPEGRVETLKLEKALQHLDSTSAVLCRQTAPLIELAYSLIAKRIGCRVLGREIGAGLVSLIKKCRARGIDQLLVKLETFREREVAKFTAKGEEMKAEAVNDKVECVLTVVNHLTETARTIPELIRAIEEMFSDQGGNLLTLSTIHKAKGKEWPIVALLRPDLCPSKWARQDWQVTQEMNLLYVVYTRAKLHLIIIAAEPKRPVGQGEA